MSQELIIIVAIGYLLMLFAIAYFVEHGSGKLSRLTGSPLVYTLSLAVYCSSWTFNGGVGRAAQSGLDFLPIYLGPTLAFCLGPIVIRRMLRISKANRITSIADLIGARFGRSGGLAALVTVIAVIGLIPYIALQLKSISSGFAALSPGGAGVADNGLFDAAFWAAVILTVFAMLFGSRSIRPGEHHPGMVVAIALESILKLASLTIIGLFVGYGLFHGFGDLFGRAAAIPDIASIFTYDPQRYGFSWISMTLLAGLASLCLPRQFQVMVVENVDERHLDRAIWQFPLYLLVINLFVLPIAIAGRLLLPGNADPDNLVLALPLLGGQPLLALVAFLGGVSAAASMVVVETTALSLMVCNDVVMPALLRIKSLGLAERHDLTRLLLWVRRGVMIVVMGLGYLYMRHDSAQFALVSIGLLSFVAVAQFAPALIGGLFWRGATKAGAAAGISVGFLLWCYTLLVPTFARSGAFAAGFVADGPFGIGLLRPYQLFGLTGLDPVTHAAFWTLLANIGAFTAVSLFGRQQPVDRAHAATFVDADNPGEAAQIRRRTALIPDLDSLASRFLGRQRANAAFLDWTRARGVDPATAIKADAETVLFYERLLAGVVGAASARVLVEAVVEEEPLGVDEIMRILDETSRVIEANRQLEDKSRALEAATNDLKQANTRLQELDRLKDDFVATVNHELRTPLASIRAFSEILRDHPDISDVDRREFLRIVVAETERLTRLIGQLLDLSKISESGLPAAFAPVDLAAVARDSASAMQQVFGARNIVLDTRLAAQQAFVMGDHDQLVQVLINLLGNAAKFSPANSGRAELSLRRLDDQFELAVSDNGPGVSPADREIVFERFRQLGDTMNGKPEGAGLGLAISQRIVTQHGGRIWVDDAPGGGAVFKLTLPALASAARPRNEPNASVAEGAVAGQ